MKCEKVKFYQKLILEKTLKFKYFATFQDEKSNFLGLKIYIFSAEIQIFLSFLYEKSNFFGEKSRFLAKKYRLFR